MILVYGAYGYTGRLVVEEATRRGIPVLVGGRDARRVGEVAAAHGQPARAFGLDAIDLDGVSAVLHCAGPFVRTAAPMVDACLAARVPYLDITGEIPVFEALAARDAEAKAAGIGLLPGAGFDVVPSDCLAAWLASRLPEATSLWLALATRGGLSHGTATTMLELGRDGGMIRRGGALQAVRAGYELRTVDFGDRERTVVAIPWGDVSTAFHSTGIPDITVYTSVSPALGRAYRWLGWASPILGVPFVHRWAQARVDAAPAGPDAGARAKGWTRIVGEVRSADGRVARGLLLAPEGYTLTAQTAVEAARRAAAGQLAAGFQTPSRAFGADFILEFPGVERTALG